MNGREMKEMSRGSHMLNYDSRAVLTHFKGHPQGGFGGSNKNIGIGCADGRIGKKWIHTVEGPDDQWSIAAEEFMERITESTKATLSYFGEHTCFVNVMRNMSVDCDCMGVHAAPVVTPNAGILASADILAEGLNKSDLIMSTTVLDNILLRDTQSSLRDVNKLLKVIDYEITD